MSYYPAGGGTYYLGSSIGSTNTTILLSSFLEPVSGTPYTMVLLNTTIAFGTIGPGTSSSEFISFTGITQNANGTAQLTGVTRGLSKKYPFLTSTTFKLPHSGQSIFILSDAPQVFDQYAALRNDNVFLGYNEAPDPLTAQGIVTNQYMLNLINGGTINIGAVVEPGIAGETLVAGNLIYFSEVDNEWLKTDADTLASVFNVKLGIAKGSGVNGGAITGGVHTFGSYTTSGLTQGDLIYASNTAGAFSNTAGTTPRIIGIAKDSTHLYFDPYFQSNLYNYGVDAVGTDSYAVTLAGAFSAYFPGMFINFKAGTANTAAATLNVNGLGAKAIVKNTSTALETGDILANQIVTVIYDGTNFQMVNKNVVSVSLTSQVTGILPIANGGTSLATRNYNSGAVAGATTSTTVIAHGIGKTPIHIKIYASTAIGGSNTPAGSVGTYNGTNQQVLYWYGNTSPVSNIDTAKIVFLEPNAGSSIITSGVASMDVTNITITWTSQNGGTANFLLWEAWGI